MDSDRAGERNKALKVAIFCVCLVGLFSLFLSYVSIQVPIFGSSELTLYEYLQIATKTPSESDMRIVSASGLNVRVGPGTTYAVIGQVAKGKRLTPLDRRDGWIKIATTEGEGWVAETHTEIPDEAMTLDNLASMLEDQNVPPEFRASFEHLPPYSPYLPIVPVLCLVVSVLIVPFVRGGPGILLSRILLAASAGLAAYSLAYHLLFARAFSSALHAAAQSASEQAGDGLDGAFVSLLTGYISTAVKLRIGSALYVLASAGLLAGALSLFLLDVDGIRQRELELGDSLGIGPFSGL